MLGLSGGSFVAHDYGVSVVQELLARGVRPDRVAWLNGGVYPELHRPVEVQELLRSPHGAELAAALGADDLAGGLQQVCVLPLDALLVADLAAAAARREGLANLHLLMGYVDDRQVHRDRWVTAMEQVAVPYLFAWGVLDPVSGGHVMEPPAGAAAGCDIPGARGRRALPAARGPVAGGPRARGLLERR